MEIWEIVVVSIALAMDAFAVSICKGLASKEKFIKTGITCGLWFGFFQALMPFLGWLLGTTVASYVEKFSSIIAFVLLAFLGIKMIREAITEDNDEDDKNSSLAPKVMVVFAVATSIDALAAGLTFAALDVNIWIAISLIGIITCVFSFFGSIIGAKIGSKCKTKAEIAGGIILIGIGLKILIEYLITLF